MSPSPKNQIHYSCWAPQTIGWWADRFLASKFRCTKNWTGFTMKKIESSLETSNGPWCWHTHLILFSNVAVLELTLEPLPTNSEWAIAPTLRGPGSRFDRLIGGCWTLGIWQQSLTCFTWKWASERFRIWFNHHCIIIIRTFLQDLFGGKCTTSTFFATSYDNLITSGPLLYKSHKTDPWLPGLFT